MTQLQTPDIAKLLKEYGLRTAMKGGNPYRARAYSTAAENLALLDRPLHEVIEAGQLTQIPGIGEAIAGVIEKMHREGTHPALEDMRREVPEGLLPLLEIPRMRASDIAKIRAAGILDIAGLEHALKSGALDNVKGFTAAFRRKLLEGIEIRGQSQGRVHIHRAQATLERAAAQLRVKYPEILEVIITGEFRRRCELVGEMSLLAVMKKETALPVGGGIKIHGCRPETKGAALLFATGSPKHLDELQGLAKKKKMSLTPGGLMRGKKRVAGESEEEIYEALGLQYIVPEMREGRGEIAKAAAGELPKLVTVKDIRGIVHAHTTASDGGNTLLEMAEAVRKRGYQYFGVSDHSQTAHYAGGLVPDGIIAQHKEADRLNKKFGKSFRIFKGIESDILPDGSLDYPVDILKKFDFVVASIHGQFKTAREAQTQRLINAVKNPYTTILGHMTGRQLLRRHGYDIDIDAILKACAENGVAVEVNGNPWRLDLDWRWHERALELGCMICINPDAHSIAEIDLVGWGVAMSRKGGVPKERVLNCMSLAEFTAYLAKRKRGDA
ncbi:MAG TPA: PHP domain-containing protein [Patescibacteria group bacterium]|nr:PHP domain-containing protein [Patescibacteria group bacterium]